MDIIIERPTLNKDTSRRNLAVVDSWIADTADKLNVFFTAYKNPEERSHRKLRAQDPLKFSSEQR